MYIVYFGIFVNAPVIFLMLYKGVLKGFQKKNYDKKWLKYNTEKKKRIDEAKEIL